MGTTAAAVTYNFDVPSVSHDVYGIKKIDRYRAY